MSLFYDIRNYFEFLKSNVKKDIRGKYKGSFLGILWSFINPLLSVLVYAIVFFFIMRMKVENYLCYSFIILYIWWCWSKLSFNMVTSNCYNTIHNAFRYNIYSKCC